MMLKAIFLCIKYKFLLIINYVPRNEHLEKSKATHHNYTSLFVIYYFISDSFERKCGIFAGPFQCQVEIILLRWRCQSPLPEESLQINNKLFFTIRKGNFSWNQRIFLQMAFLYFCEILFLSFHSFIKLFKCNSRITILGKKHTTGQSLKCYILHLSDKNPIRSQHYRIVCWGGGGKKNHGFDKEKQKEP